jgi:hypothetical protein
MPASIANAHMDLSGLIQVPWRGGTIAAVEEVFEPPCRPCLYQR